MRKFSTVLIVLAMMLVPALAIGATVEGSVQGLTCVTLGKVCPIGYEDPMAAAESTFVVFVKDDEYYLVPNLNKSILARHIGEPVKVEGTISSQYNSIKATVLYMKKDGSWVQVWSQAMQDKINEELERK